MPRQTLLEVITAHEEALLNEWIGFQKQSTTFGSRIPEAKLRSNSHEFLGGLVESIRTSTTVDLEKPEWSRMKSFLKGLSRQYAEEGYTPSETATVVFSFKHPLFQQLRQEFEGNAEGLAEATWAATRLIDALGLYTTELFIQKREELIARQQEAMLELSTPVVELWEGILALPLIGTLDSSRTQIVMQNLLEAIVSSGADLAIIDITGVATVDTLVAQHLLKTVAAARLMGADCIISGIRPQIAQTIIHLGVDLGDVLTKATLSSALQLALRRKNLTVSRV